MYKLNNFMHTRFSENMIISPQAQGSIVAFQGRSHREWGELMGLYLPKFAKRIQSSDNKLK